jgi:8-oxo-dGTP pyrophosphatase MutT (NUDIX family)
MPKTLKPVSQEQGANAAVALVLKPKRDDYDVFIAKRVKNPADPWSGQMALPGGKRTSKDKDLKETVVRETLEETGIALETCRFLGVLHAVESESAKGMKILPFVILLEEEPAIRLNEKELESFMWVPYEEIVQSKGTAEYSFGKVPAFIFADAIVWGITYKILEEFIKAVEKASST